MNAWILLGDNAYYTGRDAEFQSNFFNIYKDNLLTKYPLYPTPGNHDYYDGDSSEEKVQHTHQVAYYQNFTMPVDGEAGGVPLTIPPFIPSTWAISISSPSTAMASKMINTGSMTRWDHRQCGSNRTSKPTHTKDGSSPTGITRLIRWGLTIQTRKKSWCTSGKTSFASLNDMG
jgi:hypothetical protein